MNRLLPIVDEWGIPNKLQDAWIASGLRPRKDEGGQPVLAVIARSRRRQSNLFYRNL
ncbi:MAG TPA: hypothetical protein VMW10_10020 [Alphaproteobacteria bacterium]|nr:hypothetical protein [Alphaproteobacteria bacterium]